jgi:hypothetical protein
MTDNRLVFVTGSYLQAPSVDELAAALARRFHVQTGSLSDVAQRVTAEIGGPDLVRAIARTLVTSSRPGPVHRLLARLPRLLGERDGNPRSQLILTTNFDTAHERAFQDEQEPYDLLIYVPEGRNARKFVHVPYTQDPVLIDSPRGYFDLPIEDDLRLSRSIIVKLFGTVDGSGFDQAASRSCVITSDQLDAYLRRAPVTSLVPIQVLDSIRFAHLLFLGHAGGERSLGVLVNRLWEGTRLSARGWAIELDPQPQTEWFWRELGAEVISVDPATFADLVERRLSADRR